MKKISLSIVVLLLLQQLTLAQNKSIWVSIGDHFFDRSEVSSTELRTFYQSLNDSVAIKRTGYSTSSTTSTIKNALSYNMGISRTSRLSSKFNLDYGVGFSYMHFVATMDRGYSTVIFTGASDTVPYSTTKFNQQIDKKLTYINQWIAPKKGTNFYTFDLLIPIHLRYNLSKVFSLVSGIEISTGIFAKSSYESVQAEKVSETKDEIFYQFVVKDMIDNNTNFIPRLGVAATLQGDFRVDKRSSIALGVNYRINPILTGNYSDAFFSTNASSTQNRFIRVYLKYYYYF